MWLLSRPVSTSTTPTRKIGVGTVSPSSANNQRPKKRVASPYGWPMQTWKRRRVVLALVLSDALLALVIWGVAAALRALWGGGPFSIGSVVGAGEEVAAWILIRALLGLYPGYGLDPAEELKRQTYAVAATMVITSVFVLAFHAENLFSGLMLVLGFLALALFAPLLRSLVKYLMRRAGLWGKPVVVLGDDRHGEQVVSSLRRSWGLGFRPVAVLDERLVSSGGRPADFPFDKEAFDRYVPYEGLVAEAEHLADERGIDTAIFAMPLVRREVSSEIRERLSAKFRRVVVTTGTGEISTTSGAVTRDLGGTIGVEVRYDLLDPHSRMIKRALDLFGAVVGGLLISPLLIAIMVAIKLDSTGGPIFFGQRRLGAGGGTFRCWKFRTMHPEAERLLNEYLRQDPSLRAEWEREQKLRDDPRITRIGSLLRKTSLDELPQLWNVLMGEMSLVGPRPIVDAEIVKYGEMYGLYRRVRPGISGFWQVNGRNNTSYDERVEMDAYYVRNWSVWLDLVILARTVSSVLLSKGAY